MTLRSQANLIRAVATGGLILAVCLGMSTHALGMGLGWGDDCETTTFQSQVVDQIGLFKSPSRITLTDTGKLYVSDTGGGFVGIYDLAGVRVGTLKGVERPLGVAVLETTNIATPVCLDPKKNKKCKKWSDSSSTDLNYVWVGDETDGSVRIFENGELSDHFLGSGPGEFSKPNGIAVTSDKVYVVDSGTHQVVVYDSAGNYTGAFGSQGFGDGELDFPADIVISESTSEIYVADFRNRRIAVFDLGGTWLRNIGAPPNDDGDPIFYRPSGIGIDFNGNLYVVDNALSCVVVMDSYGTLLEAFGYQNGCYWTGELKVPIDAATDGSHVYVTSSKHRHVNVFERSSP